MPRCKLTSKARIWTGQLQVVTMIVYIFPFWKFFIAAFKISMESNGTVITLLINKQLTYAAFFSLFMIMRKSHSWRTFSKDVFSVHAFQYYLIHLVRMLKDPKYKNEFDERKDRGSEMLTVWAFSCELTIANCWFNKVFVFKLSV